MEIKFCWNGTIAGTAYSLYVDGEETFLGRNEKEAELQAIIILRDKYMIDYKLSTNPIKWMSGGRL